MPTSTHATHHDAAGLILFNAGCIYRRLRQDSRRLGISWTAITLLKDIELLEPVTQKELARVNHMSAPSISVAVKQMRASGWLSRRQDPNDGRSATLRLTRSGRAKLEADGLALQHSLVSLLQALDADTLDAVLRAEGTLARLFHG